MEFFLTELKDIPDPRASNSRHDLCELLVVAFVAALCAATSCAGMAAFWRVLARTAALLGEGDVIAIDGKALRGTVARITGCGGDYCLVLKANQDVLLSDAGPVSARFPPNIRVSASRRRDMVARRPEPGRWFRPRGWQNTISFPV